MKKFLLPILLIMMFVPFMVNAKEYCKVVSGNGKDIGSEIACGTEHFYIIDSNNNEIKMLAKYNLYVGNILYKTQIEKDSNDTRTDYQWCTDKANEYNGINKTAYPPYNEPGYCYYSVPIETDIIMQKENAKSAHIDNDGNYIYPQIGDYYITFHYNDFFVNQSNNNKYSDTNFADYTLNWEMINNTDSKSIVSILNQYKGLLEELGMTVNNMDLLSLIDIDEIINKNANISIPFKQWSDNVLYEFGNYNNPPQYYVKTSFGNLKSMVPKGLDWLYSTTYWTKTLYNSNKSWMANYYIIFVASEGKICGSGFPYCHPETVLGCGLRPVITMPNEIQYIIKTETDGKGSIEVVENSLGGETIQFKVSMNKGYRLRSIVIKTDSGEKVEFSEGEITKNDDGTFSVDKNKFTMPFENVTIQAKFELESILKNPETGDKVLFITLILLASIGIGTFIYKKKESRYNV